MFGSEKESFFGHGVKLPEVGLNSVIDYLREEGVLRLSGWRAHRVTPGAMSIHATKHSFTAMILISADGGLLPKTLLCLQEVNRRFGDRVLETLHQHRNVSLTCARTRLFTDSIFSCWVEFFHNLFLRCNDANAMSDLKTHCVAVYLSIYLTLESANTPDRQARQASVTAKRMMMMVMRRMMKEDHRVYKE